MLIDQLQFVQAAVARSDNNPALTNFRICNGRVTAFNGTLALSSPVDVGFDCAPAAMPFIKALAACSGVVTLKQEPGNRLQIASGNFRAMVPCVDLASVPEIMPEGYAVRCVESLLEAFATLRHFVGSDVTRQWSQGILLKDGSALVTNNVCIVEYWLGATFPLPVNVPVSAVKELLRIKAEIAQVQLSASSLTFHYPDGRWLRTATLSADEWPDLSRFLSGVSLANMQPIPEGLADACATLTKFNDKTGTARCWMRGDEVSTQREGLTANGVSVKLASVPSIGAYLAPMLRDVLSIATHADFSAYPRPAVFAGPKLRGVLAAVTQ